MMKRVAVVAVTVLATLMGLALIWQFWNVVVLFLTSLGVAAMMRRPAEWLIKRRVARGLAVGIVVMIGLGVIIALLVLVAPSLAARIPMLFADLGQAYTRMQSNLGQGGLFQQTLAKRLPSPDQLPQMFVGTTASNDQLALVLTLTGGLFDVLAQSLLVIFLAIYWTIDRSYFERLVLSLLPPTQRMRMRKLWRDVEEHVGAYLQATAAQLIFGGLLLFAGFYLMGIKYPVILACVTALLWLMPVIGPVVPVLPILIVGSLSGPWIALLAVIYATVIFAATFVFVERKLYHASRFASVLSLLMMLVLVDVLGVPGLLLAPLLATVLQLVIDGLLVMEPIRQVTPKPQLEILGERLTQLHEAMQATPTAIAPATANLARRLEELIAQAATRLAKEPDTTRPSRLG